MKILIVNSYRSKGGASRAALRLAASLRDIGMEVEYCAIYPDSMGLWAKLVYWLRVIADRLPGMIIARKRIMFSTGRPMNRSLIRTINASGADIVHLHWINAGGLSIEELVHIKKPVVWTLHDMWPFTGGCHYADNCRGYERGCGKCPLLDSRKECDFSRRLYNKKKVLFESKKDIFFIGLSRWISESALSSRLISSDRIFHLPNAIDCHYFHPLDRVQSRVKFSFPKQRKLVLFGAVSAVDDPRKGYALLSEALSLLAKDTDFCAVIFGGNEPQGATLECDCIYIGNVKDDVSLRALYNAADVTVVPSLEENLSNVIMESLACGTPVVCFDIGGNSDMIIHKENGYLVEKVEPNHLKEGINWALTMSDTLSLRENARKSTVERFDNQVVGEQYRKLYLNIIQKSQGPKE